MSLPISVIILIQKVIGHCQKQRLKQKISVKKDKFKKLHNVTFSLELALWNV
jgi:hypothetical protein